MVRVILRSEDESSCSKRFADWSTPLSNAIRTKAGGVRILGPAPAPTMRIGGLFRFHFQMTSPNLEDTLALWREVGLPWKLPSGVEMAVDVDRSISVKRRDGLCPELRKSRRVRPPNRLLSGRPFHTTKPK